MNRASMIANLPAILKHVTKSKAALAKGQGGLFGDATIDELKLIDVPEWDEDTRLYYERKSLGVFLSGHPMQKVAHKLEGKATHTCRERDDMLRSDSRSRIVVGGLVSKYAQIGRITIMELEDQTGRVEMMLFKDEADRYAHCLMVNALVAVRVKPRHSPTRSSLQVVEAYRLGQFRPRT